MYKKVIGILLVISLALAGCSISKGTSTDSASNDNGVSEEESSVIPVTLDVICYEYSDLSKEIWQEIKSGFESQNRDVTLNILVLPWNEANVELETRIYNEESVDIAVTDNILNLGERDLLVSPLSYTTDDMRAGVLYGIDSTYGMPLAGDSYGIYISNEAALAGGISEESIKNVGWDAIIHAMEHFSELGITNNIFVDVNDNAIDLSKNALLKSTGESQDTEGITKSIIDSVLNNKELRHMTAYDGVLGVINGKIGMAIAPGSLLHILPEGLSMEGVSYFSLPGEPYVLYDSFGVLKKSGENEEVRLNACERFLEFFYNEAYENFLSKEGYIKTIN